MELIAVEKIRVAMPEGPKDLEPGDRLSLPERVGQRLLELAPGRVKVLDALSFHPGETVLYKIPDPTSRRINPNWVDHTGVILQVDPVGMMALIEPGTEPAVNWRWVAWCYIQGKPDEK